eukprot:1160751-Pelagomonas_calceolata.AAC.8
MDLKFDVKAIPVCLLPRLPNHHALPKALRPVHTSLMCQSLTRPWLADPADCILGSNRSSNTSLFLSVCPPWSADGIHYDPQTQLYHVFFQWGPRGMPEGICWGHACSTVRISILWGVEDFREGLRSHIHTPGDLLTWFHLPPAVEPTPGGADEHGVYDSYRILV